MASNDKVLYCRHCGNCFKSKELAQHELQCSQKANDNGQKSTQKKTDDNGQEPEVIKKVLKDEDGVKETQKIIQYPEDGIKKIVTKKTEIDEDSGGVKKVVKKETKTVNDDGALTTETQEIVSKNGQEGFSKENEEALQQLREMGRDLSLTEVSCLHCNEHIPRTEYLEHAQECRNRRQM